MSCPRDLCASATLGSSPTVAARPSYGSASRYWPGQTARTHRLPKHRPKLLVRPGGVLDVAARWRSSNDSPPLRRASVLPRSATCNQYDLLFLISKLASAATPAGEDCPPLARSHRRASRHSPRESFSPLDEPLTALLILFQDQQHNSKRITSQCQTSSLQVALSKTLRPPNSPPPQHHFAGAFPIQP